MPFLHRFRNRPSSFPDFESIPSLSQPGSSAEWSVVLEKVREIRLDNGLVVLALPTPGTGAVICDIYYAGGSSADPAGRSGLTHFLEHMLFNGTRNVPRGALDRLMLRLAGQHNAETGADFCRFWSHVPRGSLELALALEADRMQGAVLDSDDFLRERQVILEEEARYREQPFEELMIRMMADLYAGHPYAHPAIGTTEDLGRITADDLREQYDRLFRPSNALIVIAGDTTAREALRLAEKRFADLGSRSVSPLPALPCPKEDRFDGRLMTIESQELVPRGAMLWKAPGPFDIASRPWGVASSILGGGRSSRLWNTLVDERQIASHVSVSLSEERLGGYLMIELELHPGQKPRAAESAILEVIGKLSNEGPTPEEMSRVAVSRASAGCWARQQTGLLATAIGTWRLFSDLKSLDQAWRQDDFVSAAEVAVVMAKLKPENCIRGWTVPAGTTETTKVSPENSSPVARHDAPAPQASAAPEPLAKPIEKLARQAISKPIRIGRKASPKLLKLSSGAIVLADPAPRQGICAIELRWRAGALEESIPGLANLTARTCEETPAPGGTAILAEVLESLGASIDSGPTGFSVQGRASDLETIVALLLRTVAAVAPSASLVSRTARKIRTELEADLDDPGFVAERTLRELAMEGLPGSTDARGTLDSLAAMRVTHVKKHAATWYRPENLILGVAGDFRTASILKRLDRSIDKVFRPSAGSISPPPQPISPVAFDRPLPHARLRVMRSPGTQTHIVMGHRTVARTHPDWVALQVLEIILGAGPGLTDLISRRLREELGLIYGVNMAMTDGAWTNPGHMRVAFSCDPADAPRAEAEAIRILAEASQGHLTDTDCLEARDHLAHSWFMSYESADDRLSSRLDAELEEWDLTLPPAWARKCARLSADDIRAAASRQIRPAHLQIVRYGP